MYKKELVPKHFRIKVGTVSSKTAGMLLSRSKHLTRQSLEAQGSLRCGSVW